MAVSTIPASPARRRIVGKIAHAVRQGEETAELYRELKIIALEDHIRMLADSAPPIDQPRRERLARLLLGGSKSDA